MNIVGLMPVRNEAWVLGLSVRVALKWVDGLVILCHNCSDGSGRIATEIAKSYHPSVVVVGRNSTEWQEMKDRQGMLEIARAMSASHLALIDADEIPTANLIPRLRSFVSKVPRLEVMTLPMFCPRNSLDRYHSSGMWGSGNITFAFADDPRWHWTSETRGGYDYHQRHPMGYPFHPYTPISRHEGGVIHLQFVNERRLRAKQALYKMQEITRWPGRISIGELNAKYNPAVYGSHHPNDPQSFNKLPEEYLAPYADLIGKYFHPDLEPWQEKECQRLFSLHGEKTFRGLDLFGVLSRSETPVA